MTGPVNKFRKHPHLLEVSALKWKSLDFAALAKQGFDILWLMGAWERSPGARQKALEALSGQKPEDIIGSPYAVFSYTPDMRTGDLKKIKSHANAAGLKLLLDFVPNHLAFDHPATVSNPEYFVHGSREDFEKKSGIFFKTSGGHILAHGKDPFFPAWTDTVQVNYFSAAARKFMLSELLKISEICDGVRCDMAMLVVNSIFAETWKDYLAGAHVPKEEFWPQAIQAVRKKKPDFIFLAETYWDTEWRLQQTGFDFTYDKKLYDRLLHGPVESIRAHLAAEPDYRNKSTRFIENHDEARSAAAFGPEKARAAAVVMGTVPGLRFFHDGQLEGKKIHVPVQLGTEPDEKPDPEMAAFYKRLLAYADDLSLHDGEWQLLDSSPANLLAWAWRRRDVYKVIVVNYSKDAVQGKMKMPEGFSPRERGVSLKPWEFHLMD